MLKPTETSKKVKILRKICKNFKYLTKISKISCIWKKLQSFQVLEKIAKTSSFWKKNLQNVKVLVIFVCCI